MPKLFVGEIGGGIPGYLLGVEWLCWTESLCNRPESVRESTTVLLYINDREADHYAKEGAEDRRSKTLFPTDPPKGY